MNKIFVNAFNPDPTRNCYCGSGKRFGQCCGVTMQDRKPPAGINIVKDFLRDGELKSFIRFAEAQQRAWLTIKVPSKEPNGKDQVIRDSSRVTQQVDLRKKSDLVASWVTLAVKEHIQPAMGNRKAERFEVPQLLRYGPGGLYKQHADAEMIDPNSGRFFRALDRDFSLLIYLNDDYTGGGLHFAALNYTYQPKAGDLVFFPSNNIFRHEAMPVSQGRKLALVSWGVFHGSPRISATPMFPSVLL